MKYSQSSVKKWGHLFNNKDLNGILGTYSPDAVLLGTFAKNIKKGIPLISTYFTKLFTKDNLSVCFDPRININEMQDGYIISGIYIFRYRENGQEKCVKARYSFVIQSINGKEYIINHHSSVVPM